MTKVLQFFFVGTHEGGGEMHSRALESAFRSRGIETKSVCFVRTTDAPAESWATIDCDSDLVLPRRVYGLFRRTCSFLRTEGPDAIICHTPASAAIVLPLAAALGIRSRVMLHHAPLSRWERHSFTLRSIDLVLGSLGVYTNIVYVAEIGLEDVPRWFRPYRRRARVIHNEIAPIEARERDDARAAFGLHDSQTCWAFVGRRTIAKGADVVAAACLRTPGSVLLVAGVPGDADDTLEAAKRAGADIRLLGPIAHDEVEDLLHAADVLVFPSRAEARALTLLEARSVGIPIVTRDLPEIRATLDDLAIYVTGDDPDAWCRAIDEACRYGRTQVDRDHARGRFTDMVERYVALVEPAPSSPRCAIGSGKTGGTQ